MAGGRTRVTALASASLLAAGVLAPLAVGRAAGPLPAGAAPAAVTPGPSLSISPSAGPVGSVVTVTGDAPGGCQGIMFAPDRPVPGGDVLLPASMRTQPGPFSASLVVPAYLGGQVLEPPDGAHPVGQVVEPGTYQVQLACNQATGPPITVSEPFQVTSAALPAGRFVGMAATPGGGGYWLAQADGAVDSYGDAPFEGSLPGDGVTPAAPVVGMAATPGGGGYWLASADGGVYAFGTAAFAGSLPSAGVVPAAPVVGIAPTADGHGYWLVGADGGVFAFGDAGYFGSEPGEVASSADLDAADVVGLVPVPGGRGYGELQVNGSVIGFADAVSNAGPPADTFSAAMVATPDGAGSWTVGTDGGVFAGGHAAYLGSLPGDGVTPAAPVVAAAGTPDGRGYWLLGADGGVFAFGDAAYLGSPTASAASLAACRGARFSASVTTPAATAAAGRPVPITLTLTNGGPTCWSEPGDGNADVLDGCPSVTATDAAGQLVWSSAAGPGPPLVCPAVGLFGAVGAGWTRTWSFTWDQTTCPSDGTPCTQEQVPAGTYTLASGLPALTGNWNGVVVAPATVTIAGPGGGNLVR